jgi:ubiquitin carboxyl-terminal hydrolase L5
MLKDFGVKGAKLQEVFSLEQDILEMLPYVFIWTTSSCLTACRKPVYGLIFLFRYTSSLDVGEQTDECPDHIWFANQVADNSCATVSLLNLVSNIPQLELGDDILRLKKFAVPFKPSLRGEILANCSFIKRVHNSFARKIDILNVDAYLEEQFERRKKPKKKKKVKTNHNEESAFHFVAYLPIGDEIWRLDGLDAFPQKIGSIDAGQDWLDLVTPVLAARMAECEDDGISFNLLALVRDPLAVATEKLARNVLFLRAVDERFREHDETWDQPPPDLFPELIDASLLESIQLAQHDQMWLILIESGLGEMVLQRREAALQAQSGLRAAVEMERAAAESDEEKAKDRRNDYGPLTQAWLRMIAANGCMRDLIDG